MLAGTHLTIGLASALAICDPRNIDQAAPVIIGAAVGSIICDMDSRDTSRIRDALYGRVIGAAVVGITVIWNNAVCMGLGIIWLVYELNVTAGIAL